MREEPKTTGDFRLGCVEWSQIRNDQETMDDGDEAGRIVGGTVRVRKTGRFTRWTNTG